MNYLKRTTVSVKRRPGKTAILLLLVFILGNIISGAISIQQAVQNTEDNLRRNLPAVATVDQDLEALMNHETATGEWIETERITADIVRQIGDLPYVEDFDFSVTTSVFSHVLARITHPNPDFEYVDWERLEVEGLERFTLQGVHNPEILDVQAGLIEIVNGRVFTEQEINNFNNTNSVAVISQEFANLNNLIVGSTFTLDNTSYDDSNIDGGWIEDSDLFREENVIGRETTEFEVIGIFRAVGEQTGGDDWWNARREVQLANRIYVPNIVTERMTNFMLEQSMEHGIWDGTDFEPNLEDMIWIEPVFRLNDPRDLVAFSNAATEILPDFWIVTDLSNTFADIASSMETMQMLASIVLWVSIGATLLILSLLITLFLRDRKHEIGIYLALGEKKMKVITQIILEVASVAVVAITLSLFTGNILASNLSENMLRQDIIARQQEEIRGGRVWSPGSDRLTWFSAGDMSMEEMMESYEISLDVTTIALFYGVGIGTILVSTLLPIAYIMRLDPKKIMM